MLLLLVAGFVRLGLLAITFGISVPAGLYVPSLAAGACIGKCRSLLCNVWHGFMLKPQLFWIVQAVYWAGACSSGISDHRRPSRLNHVAVLPTA